MRIKVLFCLPMYFPERQFWDRVPFGLLNRTVVRCSFLFIITIPPPPISTGIIHMAFWMKFFVAPLVPCPILGLY